MDWLDKLSIAAIAGITLITIGMIANQQIVKSQHNNPGVVAKEEKSSYALQMEIDKEIYKKFFSYKKQGLHAEAMTELNNIVKRYPAKPVSYVYMAQLFLKQRKLGDSIHYYRRAVEMEPDYVDQRTPLFIGDEIKKIVEEGRVKFGREKELKPKDKVVKKALQDVYYLQSRMAGGCE